MMQTKHHRVDWVMGIVVSPGPRRNIARRTMVQNRGGTPEHQKLWERVTGKVLKVTPLREPRYHHVGIWSVSQRAIHDATQTQHAIKNNAWKFSFTGE